MYVVETKLFKIDGRTSSTQMLHELTAKEFRTAEADALKLNEEVGYIKLNYRKVSAPYAHNWVRTGGLHSTGLWIDDGRIRKATGGNY